MIATIVASCSKEKVNGDFTYGGPVPAITEGSTEAQHICFYLYKEYDLHTYYTLEGDNALYTPLGSVSVNDFISNNPDALPIKSGVEDKVTNLLNQMKLVYSLFPPELISRTTLKRQVLVNVNPLRNNYQSTAGEKYYDNVLYQLEKGVAFFGDLNNESTASIGDIRYNILRNIMRGILSRSYSGITPPSQFSEVSKLYYRSDDNYNLCFDESNRYDVGKGYEYGFVSRNGASCSSIKYNDEDLVSYIVWIIATPIEKREQLFELYNRVYLKYSFALSFINNKFNINLEQISSAYNKL